MGNTLTIIGIVVSTLVAIGVAIYQVNASKKKLSNERESNSHRDIWNSLNKVRAYFENGMQVELNSIGTLKLEPIHNFRKVVTESKVNIRKGLYKDLNELYESIANDTTNESIFTQMKIFLEKKNEFPQEELQKIEIKVNKERVKIINKLEKFMKDVKKELE